MGDYSGKRGYEVLTHSTRRQVRYRKKDRGGFGASSVSAAEPLAVEQADTEHHEPDIRVPERHRSSHDGGEPAQQANPAME